MLSILIPVYNYDVRGLVSDLLSQVKIIAQPIEICLLNDGSDFECATLLDTIAESSKIRLHNFTTNQGRVASRRKLAELAQYDHLLFIDCDAEVVSDNYIINYLNNINESKVIVGGHVYQESLPEAKYRLHWEYGKDIEVRSVEERIKNPYQSFSMFNFCISKETFNNYLINVEVKGYGHEDTLIGNILNDNNVAIHNIDNPLLHAGLKEADQFLKDAHTALQNALMISKEYPDIDIKVIQYARILDSLGLKRIIIFFLNLFNNRIHYNLKSAKPSMRYLQLFKLKTLLQLTIDN